ncbi:MAG: hypothetical protein Q9179_000623 [Wetmoreana sp. 5 TL-2023]
MDLQAMSKKDIIKASGLTTIDGKPAETLSKGAVVKAWMVVRVKDAIAEVQGKGKEAEEGKEDVVAGAPWGGHVMNIKAILKDDEYLSEYVPQIPNTEALRIWKAEQAKAKDNENKKKRANKSKAAAASAPATVATTSSSKQQPAAGGKKSRKANPAKDIPNEPFKGTLYEKIIQLMAATGMKKPPEWIIPILQKDPKPECKDAADRLGIETEWDKPAEGKGKAKAVKTKSMNHSDTESEDGDAADDGEGMMAMGGMGEGLDEEDMGYFTEGVQSEEEEEEDDKESEDEEDQVFVDEMD